LKIAVVSHLKFPIVQPFAGGLELHTHLLATRLRARGHDVTLFASRGSDPALCPAGICDPTGDGCVDAVESAAYVTIMAQIAAGGFDLVHNNSLHVLPLRASRDLDVPMMTVLHTPPFEPFVDGIRDRDPAMPMLAVSRSLAAEWNDLVPGAQVVGNGIDLAAFPFGPVASPDGYVFWSGRVVPEKGTHLAIDAARAAGLKLLFAGPRASAAYWEGEIAPRLGEGVTYLGHLAQPALSRWLGGARAALVSPRWEEPFGLVVAEALACGTPVAGFRRGALPDILDGETGRLAEPDDALDLARALREATALDRAACRRRAETLFDADRMIDAYEEVYRGMLRRRRGEDTGRRSAELVSA
jgi:UDP-glucose:tetrahydrobiopterin glucosyltransferase